MRGTTGILPEIFLLMQGEELSEAETSAGCNNSSGVCLAEGEAAANTHIPRIIVAIVFMLSSPSYVPYV
jgi:hypothetical protein